MCRRSSSVLSPSLCIVLAIALLSLVVSVHAGEPPREPFLRIETGLHTAPIRRISVDAAERYLVTASHDKTARVWDLQSGKLLQILRPPLGAGNEGKLRGSPETFMQPQHSEIHAGPMEQVCAASSEGCSGGSWQRQILVCAHSPCGCVAPGPSTPSCAPPPSVYVQA